MRVLDRVADFIDLVESRVGQSASIIALGVTVLVPTGVFMRRLDLGHIPGAFDWQVMGTGALFALCGAYAMVERRDIRVDVFFDKFPPRVQSLMWIAGVVLLFWPLFGSALWYMGPWAWKSFGIKEVSPFTYGAFPGVWWFKLVLVFGVVMLLVQSVVYIYRFGKEFVDLSRGGGARTSGGGESTQAGGE